MKEKAEHEKLEAPLVLQLETKAIKLRSEIQANNL